MAKTGKDEFLADAAARSGLCAVAGAWLVCALVAAAALAFSGDLQAPAASAPIAIALMQPSR